MKLILFTDTHFGWKQNSITWYNYQSGFIYNQMIPYIRQVKKESSNEKVVLVHLGDVFDSRSSVSTYIATHVRQMMSDLRSEVDEFIIIGGNHDYYSPTSDSIDTLNLTLYGLDINIITKNIYQLEDCLFVPWYEYQKPELQDYINDNHIKNVFTHTDIVTASPLVRVKNLFSGHIHIPSLKKGLYNLGSCYPLNFADSNNKRGFYMYDGNNLKFIANNTSIHFWRLYDKEILNDIHNVTPDDYIELYINSNLLSTSIYQEAIENIISTLKNVWVIPKNSDEIIESKDFESYNIEDMIEECIPDHLKDKFKLLKQALYSDEC